MLNQILDILFPKKCLFCGKYGNYICKSCYEKQNIKYLFKKVYNDYFDYVICSSFYKGKIKVWMHNFKFHEQAFFYEYFITMSLKNSKIISFLRKFDYITYVPMNISKKNKRGYNQSELLAKELAKRLKIKVIPCLEKISENKTQSTLTEKEREENVKDVFAFKNGINLKGKNIILVDDIFTTGATMRECSKILKENGAKLVCAFAIAKTEKFKKFIN